MCTSKHRRFYDVDFYGRKRHVCPSTSLDGGGGQTAPSTPPLPPPLLTWLQLRVLHILTSPVTFSIQFTLRITSISPVVFWTLPQMAHVPPTAGASIQYTLQSWAPHCTSLAALNWSPVHIGSCATTVRGRLLRRPARPYELPGGACYDRQPDVRSVGCPEARPTRPGCSVRRGWPPPGEPEDPWLSSGTSIREETDTLPHGADPGPPWLYGERQTLFPWSWPRPALTLRGETDPPGAGPGPHGAGSGPPWLYGERQTLSNNRSETGEAAFEWSRRYGSKALLFFS